MVRPKRAVSNAKKQKSIESSGGEPVAPPTASEETSEQHTQNTNETRSKEDDVPPTVRKRRLASLNAEYLVHYCSTANNHNSNTNENANNHHSGNSQPQTNNTTNAGGGANKRRRTISSRATTTNDDESTINKAKRRSTAGANKKVAKEAETEEEQEDKEEAAVVEPVKRKTSLRGKRKKKEEEDEEEKTEDEEEEKTSEKETGKRGRRNGRRASATNQSKKAKEPVVETFVSTRPRREAGLRASAMIIQTNEIEKSNRAFQFIHSAQNTVHNGSNGAEKKLKSSPKSNKVEKSGKEIVNKKHQLAANNNHTFQVPQAVSVFAASQQRQATAVPSPDQDIKPIISNAGGNSNIMSHVNLLSKKKQLSAAYTSNNNLSNNSTAANNTFPLRQISTCTTMGSLSALAPTPGATVGNDQDSSSNEVTIVAEKSGNLLNGVKSPVKLTEASLAEHNRINGTTSGTSGASTFSNHTKEHINRWAAEHAKYFSMTGEPFKADYVPIESFGIKTHNDPQYKTQSGGSNGHHAAAAEKNMVASSVGKTNLTGKLSGVVGAGGASGIKQDPHIKLNGNSKELIKPTTNHVNHNNMKKTKVKKCAVN